MDDSIIESFIKDLIAIWGRDFKFPVKDEIAKQNVLKIWKENLTRFNAHILNDVKNYIINANISACTLPEIVSLCKKIQIEKKKLERQELSIFSKKSGWCPACNNQISTEQAFCECGWEIKIEAMMLCKYDDYLWDIKKIFDSEMKFLKEKGIVKNGYEYFKLKAADYKWGNIILSKIPPK